MMVRRMTSIEIAEAEHETKQRVQTHTEDAILQQPPPIPALEKLYENPARGKRNSTKRIIRSRCAVQTTDETGFHGTFLAVTTLPKCQ